jgi:hypothetical protein
MLTLRSRLVLLIVMLTAGCPATVTPISLVAPDGKDAVLHANDVVMVGRVTNAVGAGNRPLGQDVQVIILGPARNNAAAGKC